jgi:hypothetical protein
MKKYISITILTLISFITDTAIAPTKANIEYLDRSVLGEKDIDPCYLEKINQFKGIFEHLMLDCTILQDEFLNMIKPLEEAFELLEVTIPSRYANKKVFINDFEQIPLFSLLSMTMEFHIKVATLINSRINQKRPLCETDLRRKSINTELLISIKTLLSMFLDNLTNDSALGNLNKLFCRDILKIDSIEALLENQQFCHIHKYLLSINEMAGLIFESFVNLICLLEFLPRDLVIPEVSLSLLRDRETQEPLLNTLFKVKKDSSFTIALQLYASSIDNSLYADIGIMEKVISFLPIETEISYLFPAFNSAKNTLVSIMPQEPCSFVQKDEN